MSPLLLLAWGSSDLYWLVPVIATLNFPSVGEGTSGQEELWVAQKLGSHQQELGAVKANSLTHFVFLIAWDQHGYNNTACLDLSIYTALARELNSKLSAILYLRGLDFRVGETVGSNSSGAV